MLKFFDQVKVYLEAGSGGNGASSFRREKYVPRGGPDGGNGGKGGNIILQAKDNLNTLVFFHYNVHHKADNGKNGFGQNRTGVSGEDKILFVPMGTQVFDESGEILLFDLDQNNKSEVVAYAGQGGIGNAAFKTSYDRAPRKATKGEKGQAGWFVLKLKLISDVGIIGMPNAGKSSLLTSVTNAKSKVADYPFTTLQPTLGVVKKNKSSFVLCDIPGLIEGAHNGAGLADHFLQHIERCKILIHLIDCSNEDPVKCYKLIRKELLLYNKDLKNKKEIIVLNKIDSISEKKLPKLNTSFTKKTKKEPLFISTHTFAGINDLIKKIFYELKNSEVVKKKKTIKKKTE
jgi:GTP-binding protein